VDDLRQAVEVTAVGDVVDLNREVRSGSTKCWAAAVGAGAMAAQLVHARRRRGGLQRPAGSEMVTPVT
jgi:hypothetical protein